MKKIAFFILITLSGISSYSQGYVQLVFGYTPLQATSVNTKGTANAYEINMIGISDGSFVVGGGKLGVGVYTFRGIPNEEIYNTKDPFKKSMSRIDIHAAPMLGVGTHIVKLVCSPQFGLFYCGMTSNGPKLNTTLKLDADLIIANAVSLGISYSPFNLKLVSTNWNSTYLDESYILIKPSLQFKISLLISGNNE
mgnify:CR=1 FL=1